MAGSYHPVAVSPVGPFQAFVAIPKGMIDAASVIFLVFLVGGAFSVVDHTGALRQGAEWLAVRLGHRSALVVPIACAVFALDTIIQAMLTPLARLPSSVFAVGMSLVQTAITVPVPSSSGRAVLTMPILIPLSDLLGVSRQVTVLAYQYGPGVIGQMLPTDGALMAILTLAGVRYEQWVRFAAPLCAVLFVLAVAAIASPSPSGSSRRPTAAVLNRNVVSRDDRPD